MRHDTPEALDQVLKVPHGFGKRDFERSGSMIVELSPLCGKGAGGPVQSDPRAIGSHDVTVARLAAVRVTLGFVELRNGAVTPTICPRLLNERESVIPMAVWMIHARRLFLWFVSVARRRRFEDKLRTRYWSTRQQTIAVIRIIAEPANYIWIAAAVTECSSATDFERAAGSFYFVRRRRLPDEVSVAIVIGQRCE